MMPRNMSFYLTKEQVRKRIKTVTRRNGWWFLKTGHVLNAVEKSRGLKKGERIVRICLIRVVSSWAEPLNLITDDEVKKEGFPNFSRWDFIKMYTEHNNCPPHVIVNRIGFEYLGGEHAC